MNNVKHIPYILTLLHFTFFPLQNSTFHDIYAMIIVIKMTISFGIQYTSCNIIVINGVH